MIDQTSHACDGPTNQIGTMLPFYSDRWKAGADSLRMSTIRDHAKSDQHQHGMSILCMEKGSATHRGCP